DLMALVGKLGSGAGYYDLNGHYIRAQAAGSNLFAYDVVGEQLNPIGLNQIYDAYPPLGLGPFTRCPGGASQPNARWPTPEAHPFLAEGELAGACGPNDVPPGPGDACSSSSACAPPRWRSSWSRPVPTRTATRTRSARSSTTPPSSRRTWRCAWPARRSAPSSIWTSRSPASRRARTAARSPARPWS